MCEACEKCQIGGVYQLNGICGRCGEYVSAYYGSYMGLFDGFHKFRVHPRFICPGCGELREYSELDCKRGINVTVEFSHWIGKRA